jgi:hypothetical protein
MNNRLRAFDTVSTPNGKGMLISQDGQGKLLVVIKKKDLVGKSCSGPCINVWIDKEDVIKE